MALLLKTVVREFTLTTHSTPDVPNCVFDSYTYTPQAGLTRFTRRIQDAQKPWVDTAILDGDGAVLGTGEDPRPFIWNGSPCVSAACYNPGYGFLNQI